MDSQRRRYAFFMINYFVQSAIGIAYEPLNYVLKDHLRLTAGAAAGFMGLITLPLLFKPLYGLVTDFLPIGRYRRKPHMVLAALAASGAFFAIAAQSRYTYVGLAVPMALSCLALAFADVVCGGVLVEDGKESQLTGRYQAIHIGGLYFGVIVVGAGGGWMTAHVPFPKIFALAGLLPLAIAAAVPLIRETPTVAARLHPGVSLGALLRTKSFWALSLTIVLWNFYPFLGTVQFYYQSNVLHLTPQWIGSLMTVGSVAGLIGSAVYWTYCRGRDIDVWASWGPVGMAVVSLTYLFYWGPVTVTLVEIVFGFASVFFRLALLDLIARACPRDAEATSYAIFLAFFDLAMFGSNTVGGKIYDLLQNALASQAHHDQLSAMILVLFGALCTLSCRWTLRFSRTTTS